ncbi:3-methyladenine DNA glycosylase [Aeromicrobium sp. YIM 150415]|uniref:3-methyladenine DNA glycosylase n=1 Tax=Aeromicrobium sp. YIM 150415 TaxID=2803912 RepID=UPI0019627B22|nr:3-methyladenine DNA glycosylase [Aeromicrobium sp. YIM 150415]MBM9462813.1 3-methyladenine DNA glycosylase [Aeromicrobium sp. YIM 150415]
MRRLRVLSRTEWSARAEEHRARVEPWTRERVRRRELGEKHPVWDFLFEYYNLSPGGLERWHPGLGHALAEAPEYARLASYARLDDRTVTADLSRLPARLPGLTWTRELLSRTAERPARWGCFGLHEWAMVYRQPAERRHAARLRLGPSATDAVVESHRLACTHADAYRFYTADARPLNRPAPTRDNQLELEQPGCLHANMDLYRIAFRMLPFLDSDTVADAFELAAEIREVDMRASPYDLRAHGFDPIAVETAEGKAEYVRRQRDVAARAEPLRERLLRATHRLIENAQEDAA